MITTVGAATPIRPAMLGDLSQLEQLELDGFDSAERWSEASWRAELVGSDRIVLAAMIADQVVGAGTWQAVGETADLHRIVVSNRHRRMGVASALLTEGLCAVQAAGVGAVLLEVAADNEGAQALYRKFGFTELATRADYYGAGRHAKLMRLDLADGWRERGELRAQRPKGSRFGPKLTLSPDFSSESSVNNPVIEGCES